MLGAPGFANFTQLLCDTILYSLCKWPVGAVICGTYCKKKKCKSIRMSVYNSDIKENANVKEFPPVSVAHFVACWTSDILHRGAVHLSQHMGAIETSFCLPTDGHDLLPRGDALKQLFTYSNLRTNQVVLQGKDNMNAWMNEEYSSWCRLRWICA